MLVLAHASTVFAEAVHRNIWAYTVHTKTAKTDYEEDKIYIQVAVRCYLKSGHRLHFSTREKGTPNVQDGTGISCHTQGKTVYLSLIHI